MPSNPLLAPSQGVNGTSSRSGSSESSQEMVSSSTRILSKYGPNTEASFSGVSLVTQILGIPNSSRFFNSALALELLISLDTRSPSPRSLAPSSVLLPPGAAHRSSTLSPGQTGRTAAGAMALGSCR